MAILVDETSRIIIQGLTGKVGQEFSRRMVQNKTPLVGGVTPGRGGSVDSYGVPVFDSVRDALQATHADWSLICVPALAVRDAVIEAVDAGIKKIVVYAEGVPAHDALAFLDYAGLKNVKVFGPNSAGVFSPGRANVSDLDDRIVGSGNVGILSKSGTLTYEVIEVLKQVGRGVSTVVCLGGDPLIGIDYVPLLKAFSRDEQTKIVVLLGEPGGDLEIKAAHYIRRMKKPVVAYIVGQNAPRGKKMGHAGALVSSQEETAESKKKVLRDAGAYVVATLTQIPIVVKSL
jgi:succinyl-CoA synthetase alpha subunit